MSHYQHYNYHKDMTVDDFVNHHLYYNQTEMIDDLLMLNLTRSDILSENLKEFDSDNIYCKPDPNAKDEDQDIMSWWLVTPFLARELKKHSEAILDTTFGTYWGRTNYGQSIADDKVIQDIYNEIFSTFKKAA